MKSTNLQLINSVTRSLIRHGLFLTVLVLACFALSPQVRADCQEGCLTNENTVLGDDALVNNTAEGNTAVGFEALFSNTGGSFNIANGDKALFSNTAGNYNTATGHDALFSNTSGFSNTAIGSSTPTGNNNTATGAYALFSNTDGVYNTANGFAALDFNTIGSDNTASGYRALFSNTTGNNNTAIGFHALGHNNRGRRNIALGFEAGLHLTRDDNIDIGNRGVTGDSNTIRIGTGGTQSATFIAGISGVTVAGGVGVIIDANGHLGTMVSSERFKEAIKPMENASETIYQLRPVSYRYKKAIDPTQSAAFGLIAEDVAEVNPNVVARDAKGQPESVHYEMVNAMLLNEFLKEHRTVQEQGATITRQRKDFEAAFAQQQKQIEALTATVKEQAAQIQKVSAQFELSKPAPQTVNNP